MMAGAHGKSATWMRRIGTALLWAFAVLIIGAAITLVGVHLLGSAQGWAGWFSEHRYYLLAWRVALYAAALVGWCWMRKRLLKREPDEVSRARLRRTELAAVAVIVALESTMWLASS